MNLKKSYQEQYGYTRVVTDRNSPLTFEELDFLMLADGQSFTVHETGKEFVLMILYGTCSVKGEGFAFDSVGKRKSVFDGAADAVYIGKDTDFIVTGKGGDVKNRRLQSAGGKILSCQTYRRGQPADENVR